MKDPLAEIRERVNFEAFRPTLEKRIARANNESGGRPAYDVVLMFKILIVGIMFDLSDDALELRIYDSYFVQRFLGLDDQARIPDAKTIWAFREQLTKSGGVEHLFAAFDKLLRQTGVTYSKARIIDAKIIEVPVQRNTNEENAEIKAGRVPDAWSDDENAAMLRQKDTDARWTQKHGKSYFGYKDHVKVDEKTKLIMSYDVTPASLHDSQAVDDLLESRDRGCRVYADSAYMGDEVRESIEVMGASVQIIRRRGRGRELSKGVKRRNSQIAKHRARVEHVFGAFTNDMKVRVIRCIGMTRARARIGLINLVYNIKRAMFLKQRRLRIGWI